MVLVPLEPESERDLDLETDSFFFSLRLPFSSFTTSFSSACSLSTLSCLGMISGSSWTLLMVSCLSRSSTFLSLSSCVTLSAITLLAASRETLLISGFRLSTSSGSDMIALFKSASRDGLSFNLSCKTLAAVMGDFLSNFREST